MRFRLMILICVMSFGQALSARADSVLDWNSTLCDVMQTDGILNTPALANPGWSTRTMAMLNGAIYDAFQATNRTNTPFLYFGQAAAGTSVDAAVNQASYEIIK